MGEATVIVPESFKSDKPFKIFTHGFASKVKEDPKTAFVDAWMRSTGQSVNVILGVCLAELSNQFVIPGSEIHLAGHSLGSHLMGKAGRILQEKQSNGELV